MPRVSIISPSYNATEEQLSNSYQSLLEQTSQDFEWITIDDGSTMERSGFAFDIFLEKNYGPSVARNLGFQISSGEIITYLDMGDYLHPERVENIIKLYDKYPNLEMVFCAYDIHYPSMKKSERFDHLSYIGKYENVPTAYEYLQLLQKQNISIPMGVSHKRRPFVEAGGFQRGIVCGEDGVLWRRMVDKIHLSNILFSDDIAGIYYITGNGQSRSQRRFEMGGFAINGNRKDNGKYLDDHWFSNYWSEGLYDEHS